MRTERLKQIGLSAMKNVLISFLLLMSLRPAVALYWDKNGGNLGAGGATPTGTWGVDSYWNTNVAGFSFEGTQAWESGKAAIFSAGTDAAGTFTVNVSGTQTAQFLTFEEGNVTLSGGSLILNDAGGTINVGYFATATLNSVLAGSTGLTKNDLGTLILGGANTYSAATVVQQGVLQLGASGVIPTGSGLVIKNTTAARATFATGGFSQSLGALSVQGADWTYQRVIDFGNGTSALALADSSSEDWNNLPLLIVNYTPGVDSLRFGTSSTGVTSTQLGLIRFADFGNATGQIDSNGFVTPLLPSGSWIQLTWAAADNRTYQVQYKDNIDDAGWSTLSPDVVALGTTASTIDTTATGASRFYRVAVMP
jgi:autotransporter-associated beta strand protein